MFKILRHTKQGIKDSEGYEIHSPNTWYILGIYDNFEEAVDAFKHEYKCALQFYNKMVALEKIQDPVQIKMEATIK